MSAPRGRGTARGRALRGNTSSSGAYSRGKGNSSNNSSGNSRPPTGVWTRGQRGDRVARGNLRGHNNARPEKSAVSAGLGELDSPDISGTNASSGTVIVQAGSSVNSTPFAQDDYKSRLDHIREVRPKQRAAFIQQGKMNPEGQMRLSDSVKLIGICNDMCPEYERVRRIVEDDVKPPECTPETEHLPRKQRIPDESRMVKAYTRSAAGMDVELISEIRSPATCLKTLEYLMERLDEDEFEFLHSWIWDRTRAIRKDLRTQRIEKRPDINMLLTCLERSARFLLLSAHQMSQVTNPDYSHQQDIEQLNQTLMSLQERYSDNRRATIPSDNEAEFWAYRLILAPLYTSNQLENELHSLPSDLRHNERVKTAIKIYQAFKSVLITKSPYFVQAQANWRRFWALVRSNSVSYLMACAAEISFNRVRHVVLDTIWRAYRQGTSRRVVTVDDWTTDRLKGVLGLDTDFEAVKLCELHGFQFSKRETGETFLDISQKGYSNQPLSAATEASPQIFSQGIVEVKRRDRSYSAVVQGLTVAQARASGHIFDSEHMDQEGSESESTLFVPEPTPSSSKIFNQQVNGNMGGKAALNPSANHFLPDGKSPAIPAMNPFLPKSGSSAIASPNPFLTAAKTTEQPQPFLGANRDPKLASAFDATNNAMKFAPSNTLNSPFSVLGAPSLFKPATPSPLSNPVTVSDAAPRSNPFAKVAAAPPTTIRQDSPIVTAAPATPLIFSSLTSSESTVRKAVSPVSSFTPAGSPVLSGQNSETAAELQTREEQLKANLENEQKRKAENEHRRAVKERQRAEQEHQRAQAEVAARKLEEAEGRRAELLRRQQEELRQEQERRTQEERERVKEEQVRIARIQEKQSALNALTVHVMFDPEEGLMLQFIENMVKNITKECAVKVEKEERERAVNERFEARRLGLLRAAMAFWVTKMEKKKRAQQARKRRVRLREQKARMAGTEEKDFEDASSAGGSVQPADAPVETSTVKQPAASQRTRRAKRIAERQTVRASQCQLDESLVRTSSVPSDSIRHRDPLSTTSVISPPYSDAYKSTAPIDRTETDWFAWRALGVDPSKHRKRSFDSESGNEEQKVMGSKRPKMLPPPLAKEEGSQSQPSLPSTLEEQLARFRAVQEAFRKSTSPSSSLKGVHQRSSQSGGMSELMAKARDLVTHLPKANAPLPAVQHDFGRSVPNLIASVTSYRGHPVTQSSHVVSNDNRPAYWTRTSRFVPKELYGQGPVAIRAYNAKYKSQSPTTSRLMSAESTAISSPFHAQFAYSSLKADADGPTAEESRAHDLGQLAQDIEKEHIRTANDEIEQDRDIDDVQAPLRPYYSIQQNPYVEPDEDSGVADQYCSSEEQEHEPIQYGQGQFDEQFDEQYVDEGVDSDDDEDSGDEVEDETGEGEEDYTEDEDGDEDQHSVQPAQRFTQMGNTEADAIELSD